MGVLTGLCFLCSLQICSLLHIRAEKVWLTICAGRLPWESIIYRDIKMNPSKINSCGRVRSYIQNYIQIPILPSKSYIQNEIMESKRYIKNTFQNYIQQSNSHIQNWIKIYPAIQKLYQNKSKIKSSDNFVSIEFLRILLKFVESCRHFLTFIEIYTKTIDLYRKFYVLSPIDFS